MDYLFVHVHVQDTKQWITVVKGGQPHVITAHISGQHVFMHSRERYS